MTLRIRSTFECGTASQHVAEVEAWIYDAVGQSSQAVVIRLACPS